MPRTPQEGGRNRHAPTRRKRRIRPPVQDANYGMRWLQVEGSRCGTVTRRRSGLSQLKLQRRRLWSELLRPASARTNAITRILAFPKRSKIVRHRKRAYMWRADCLISDPFARFKNAENKETRRHDAEPLHLLSSPGRRFTRATRSEYPGAQGEGEPPCRCSSCRAGLTTMCCRRSSQSSWRRIKPRAAPFDHITCSKAANTSGSCEARTPQTDKARAMVKVFVARQLKNEAGTKV